MDRKISGDNVMDGGGLAMVVLGIYGLAKLIMFTLNIYYNNIKLNDQQELIQRQISQGAYRDLIRTKK